MWLLIEGKFLATSTFLMERILTGLNINRADNSSSDSGVED